MAVAASERQVVEAVPKRLFVAGEWREASGGGEFAVEDPATGEVLCRVADATAEDALAALAAADRAQRGWADTPPNERAELLWRAFEELRRRADELALLMTLEMGKALAESRAEVLYAAEFFRWFSGEALRLDGYVKRSGDGRSRLIVTREPVGPCLLITPWNFPLAMGTRKIGPALAAGCTMVWKPAQLTPLSALALAGVLAECGLPRGVLNVVPASDARAVTEPLLRDPRLRKVSFTGSTAVGRRLMAAAGERVLRVSMELGGNAPFLVFDDADLDAALAGAVTAKMRNVGEACTAANRFLVAEAIADEFARGLAARFSELRIGRGSAEETQVGPLVSAEQRQKVAELVTDAVDRGARVLTGGNAPAGPGYFYEPTVLYPVPDGARLLREEIFGPVAPIRTFTSEEEAVAEANASEYGLVAYVYTRDLDRARRVCERLEFGMVGLNQGIVSNAGAPFGGVKQSGIGREGGNEGIDEYLETKYVALAAG